MQSFHRPALLQGPREAQNSHPIVVIEIAIIYEIDPCCTRAFELVLENLCMPLTPNSVIGARAGRHNSKTKKKSLQISKAFLIEPL
jgi:hypothetical protein